MGDVMSESVKTAMLIFLAAVGGGIGYVNRELKMGRKIQFFRTIFAVFLAAFFAYLIKIMCFKLGLDQDWTILVVGVTSFLGPDITVKLIERMVFNRLGIGHGYFHINSAEEVPSTVGSTAYLRADVFPTVAEVRESGATENNKGSNGSTANADEHD